MKNKHSFWYRNSLSIVLTSIFFLSLLGQIYTGWYEYNEELSEKGGSEVSLPYYLTTGHFFSATFENWQSEFLQMALYVLLTVSLRQWGSSESKPLEGEEEVDREPKPGPDAPWPVRKGGL
ncbi:MAG: hypothetical protein K2X86_16505, partial [Cytophagaceae bacterium]|nr:hypothetical protein [Cytophagaceae bacterium]